MRSNRLLKFSPVLRQSIRLQSDEKLKRELNTDMFNNPYIQRHQERRDNVSPSFHKQTTGLTGMYAHNLKYSKFFCFLGMLMSILTLVTAYFIYFSIPSYLYRATNYLQAHTVGTKQNTRKLGLSLLHRSDC